MAARKTPKQTKATKAIIPAQPAPEPRFRVQITDALGEIPAIVRLPDALLLFCVFKQEDGGLAAQTIPLGLDAVEAAQHILKTVYINEIKEAEKGESHKDDKAEGV